MATKVDTNPFSSGGKADLTDISGYKQLVMMVVSFGVFFTAMAFGRDLAEKIQNFLAQTLGLESKQNGPTIKVA